MAQEPLLGLEEKAQAEHLECTQFEGRVVSRGEGKCTLILHASGDISLHQVRGMALKFS